jgi:hypothetical protein
MTYQTQKLVFINRIDDHYIHSLAQKDIKTKKIKAIREIFSDYLVINKRIFSLTSYVGSQMLRLKGANLKESIFGT